MIKFAVAASFLGALISAPAQAAIVNISANDSAGVAFTFEPGQYLIKWIGTADGGLYDSAGGIALCQGCTVGFSNGLAVRDSNFGSNNYDVDFFTTRAVYGSAGQSLAAYKAGTDIYHDWAHFVNFALSNTGTDGLIPVPFIADPDDGTYRFLVFDADGTRDNNTGGISLSIEKYRGAVPEPATWGLLITGIGIAGAAMRRKQTTNVHFAAVK